jgi:hypothetical protein
VSEVLERLEAIRIERGLSEGAFSKLCGWRRTQYGVVAKRLRDGTTKNIDPATAKLLEEKLGVRAEWLMFGTEPRDVTAVAPRYPEREEALASYPDLDPEVRREIASMVLHASSRPTKARWMAYIDATIAAKAKGERLGAPSVETEDETPPIARRGR